MEYEYTATYCPEDDKIRLYTGRVERALYDRLRAEGWTSTPKQGCDFVAVWTKRREDTALELCGEIDDEDQSPADRAADRAERFGGYRDKRMGEALGMADNYESRPLVHGYQSQAKAERAAARHERTGRIACSQWEKAEYWTRRTEGVISNALYKLKPSVRMGRIKALEADERKIIAGIEEHNTNIVRWEKLQTIADPERRTMILEHLCSSYYNGSFEWEGEMKSLYQLQSDGLTLEQLQGLYLGRFKPVTHDNHRGLNHVRLRLQYERAMLEAHGGLAGEIEMQVGGWIGSHQIHKIHKSNASGRVVSVTVLKPYIPGIWSQPEIEGTGMMYAKCEVEKMGKGIYREPTADDVQKVKDFCKAKAKTAPKAPPLINPTREEAEKLQALWNAEARKKYSYLKGDSQVVEMTQAQYSARSKGDYSPCETIELNAHGLKLWRRYNTPKDAPVLCKVRGMHSGETYGASRVVILTDKPQKALPELVPAQEVTA